MAEEGQKAWEAYQKARQQDGATCATWDQLWPETKRGYATVERTIANEALRRAAEVARGFWRISKPEGVSFYDAIADQIEALIKEPGHGK